MELAEYGESLAYDVAFWMQGLDNPEYPPGKLGTLSLELSDKLRALAIITLLVKAETDFFYHNLIRSGRARETYLRRARDAGLLEDHHRVLGRVEPLLDAIAAGDFDLPQRVRALAPASLRQGHEYEDDHHYAALLCELSAPSPDDAALAASLSALERALAGLDTTRLEVLRAIVERDHAAFLSSFEALLDKRGAEIEDEKKRGKLEDPAVAAQRRVFVEGLALLRLAERRGLPTDGEFRYCPSLARVPMVAPFPGV